MKKNETQRMFGEAVMYGDLKIGKRLFKKLLVGAEDVPLFWSLASYDKAYDGLYQSFLDGIHQGYVSGYLAAKAKFK